MRQMPPSLDSPSAGELVELLKTGRTLRKMGRQGLYRFLRWGPMPIGDLVSEWIETPVARARRLRARCVRHDGRAAIRGHLGDVAPAGGARRQSRRRADVRRAEARDRWRPRLP